MYSISGRGTAKEYLNELGHQTKWHSSRRLIGEDKELRNAKEKLKDVEAKSRRASI